MKDGYTSVLWVCILTFLTLPFLENVGEDPENPGFCIPRPSLGLGFFKLDRSGDLVTDDSTVEPLEPNVVELVVMDAMLPLVADAYGLPLASVIEIPPSERKKFIVERLRLVKIGNFTIYSSSSLSESRIAVCSGFHWNVHFCRIASISTREDHVVQRHYE